MDAAVGLVSLEFRAVTAFVPSRAIRWLLLVIACLGAISLFLLATAAANTSLFAQRYDMLLLLNTALVILLMALVGYQLRCV